MADPKRQARTGEAIRQFLAEKLARGLRTPGAETCTVTAVDVTSDLKHARVHVCALGGVGDRERLLEALQRASSFLRGEVGRALRLKHAPTLEFRYDESVDQAAHLQAVLAEALAQDRLAATARGEAPPTPPGGPTPGKE
jgi:ribosome-binding factor A